MFTRRGNCDNCQCSLNKEVVTIVCVHYMKKLWSSCVFVVIIVCVSLDEDVVVITVCVHYMRKLWLLLCVFTRWERCDYCVCFTRWESCDNLICLLWWLCVFTRGGILMQLFVWLTLQQLLLGALLYDSPMTKCFSIL